jgi:two-component system, chemotaxis family, chemotaxis protein CheY
MKSLVVDDELTSRLILEGILTGIGDVLTAADGSEAVQAVIQALDANDPFDLICIDLLMPVMNGLEAIQLIRLQEERRQSSRPARIVVITSSEDATSIDAAFRHLVNAYIVKPVDAEALLSVVGCLCEAEGGPA